MIFSSIFLFEFITKFKTGEKRKDEVDWCEMHVNFEKAKEYDIQSKTPNLIKSEMQGKSTWRHVRPLFTQHDCTLQRQYSLLSYY